MGPNIDVSPIPNNQAEEWISVNPNNSNNVFVTSISINASAYAPNLWAAYSTGGGAPNTWNGRPLATGTDGGDGLPRGISDPKATFDQFGNLFVVYLTQGVLWSGFSSGKNGKTTDKLLNDSGQKWANNEWANFWVKVDGPKGEDMQQIVSNTSDTLTVAKPWDDGNVPDANSSFQIVPPNPNDRTIVVAESTDGGKSFQFVTNTAAPVNGELDYPTLAVGPGPRQNTDIKESLWLSYKTRNGVWATGVALNAQGKISSRWSAPEMAPGSAGGRVPDISVGPIGQVVVAYWLQSPDDPLARGTIVVNTSSGGLSGNSQFGAPVVAATTGVLSGSTLPANSQRDITPQPHLAWDLSGKFNNTSDGRLYLVYTDTASQTGTIDLDDKNKDTDNFFVVSNDSGQNWSTPKRLNEPNSSSQFFPSIAVDQKTGYVAFAWYDARDSVYNCTFREFLTVGLDRLTRGGDA